MAAAQNEIGVCLSSRCRATVRLARSTEGGPVLRVDLDLDPAGEWIPVLHRGQRKVRPRGPGDAGRPGFVAHAATCGDPAVRIAARQGSATDRGPCAGCGWPDHIAYGAHSGGPLCGVCASVLDGWRATPAAQRGRLVYPVWDPATGSRVERAQVRRP